MSDDNKRSFFEKLMTLRLLGLAVYERANLSRSNPATLNTHLQPLVRELNAEIDNAVHSSIKECVNALAMLDRLAEGHRAEARRNMERAEDLVAHANNIKEQLRNRMLKENVTTLAEGDHFIVLNKINGKDHVSYR